MTDHITLFQNTQDRYRFIEFCLQYKGYVSRADVFQKFEISEASASRIIKEYIDRSGSKNAQFNTDNKLNEISPTFAPLFEISEQEALYWLQLENIPQKNESIIDHFPKINIPSNKALIPIIRAIMSQKCLEISYLSLNSGQEKNYIVIPHALFNTGLKLYVRLFDRSKNTFKDFSPSRITKARMLDEIPSLHELRDQDTLWNEIINISLVPHPKFSPPQAEIIAYEYQMIRRQRIVPIRKSLINYFLRTWNVDCSKDASLDPYCHHLWLENRESIESLLHSMVFGA